MKVAKPLRVLYVITKATWGGAQRYVFDLAVGAREAGDEVLVVYGTDGELVQRLHEAGVRTQQIGSMERDIKAASEVASFKALLRIVQAFRPDVIHGNSSKAGFLAALAGRLLSVRHIIFTAHGWAFNEQRSRWQKDIFWLFHYATVLLSHVTICVSYSMLKDASSMPFVSKKFKTIHNGIDSLPLVPRADARTHLADFPQKTWIGSIAELHPTKQLHILIEAFARIAKDFPDTALVLIGEGEERERLEALILKHSLSERVRMCGHVRNASSYMHAFDIFVLPSRSEALGYVVLEAGYAATPVIASRVGGIPEIVTDGESGTLVTSGDVQALTHALREYLESPALRTVHAKALQDRIHTAFSKNEMLEQTFALY